MQPKLAEHPRMEVCLNGIWQWRFGPDREPLPAERYDPRRTVRVPGICQLDDQTQEVGTWYRKVIPLPASLRGADPTARWYLRFEKAGWYTRPWVNGKAAGEHFGSSSPFEFDVTELLEWGADNEFAIHLHAADADHTLPSEVVPDLYDSIGYRSGGRKNRNWVQILGDVSLRKRPITHIRSHVAETSVRKSQLRVRGRLHVPRRLARRKLTVHATVASLDDGKGVLEFDCPVKPAEVPKAFDHTVDWKNPVLWGFGKYGKAHLYGLRLELRDVDGEVLDVVTSRFGFREVWYDGRKLMLNGKELFIAATAEPHGMELVHAYHHADGIFERNHVVRYCQVLRKHGWNAVHNHFDTYGDDVYDVADELGMLVVAGFYCSGPAWLTPQSSGHAGWGRFTAGEFDRWVAEVAGHPSIVMWSTFCGAPGGPWGVKRRGGRGVLDEAAIIRAHDKTNRPILGCDVDYAKQGLGNIRKDITDKLSGVDGPRFVKEVWGLNHENIWALRQVRGLMKFLTDNDVSGYVTFGTTFPPVEFRVSWPADSGYGVRYGRRVAKRFTGPINWCDPSKPLHGESRIAQALGAQYKRRWGAPGDVAVSAYPHVLTEGHSPDAAWLAVEALTPVKPAPRVILLDERKRGYTPIPYPGRLRLHQIAGKEITTREVDAPRIKLTDKPGYDDIVRVKWKR